MYTQGQEFQTGATTTNYTTQQYNYQYQYQMPTTTKTTTTTQQFTTTTPVTYSQQYTTSQPITYTQQYTTAEPTTTSFTTSVPMTSYTTSVPTTSYTTTQDYTQAYVQPQTFTTTQTTTTVPTYSTQAFGTAPLKPQPAFKLLRQGSGISPNEQQGIVSSAMTIYQNGMTPISNKTVSLIKKTLGGDWIVIVYQQGRPIDFNMTCVQGNDYMYFTLDNTAYQVCRLR
jgi:hypothetical protein